MVYTLCFFPLQNAVCFIILTFLLPVLFTFYIQCVLKLKKIIPAPSWVMSSKMKFLSDIPLTMTASRFLQNDKNCSPDNTTHRTSGILNHIAVKLSKTHEITCSSPHCCHNPGFSNVGSHTSEASFVCALTTRNSQVISFHLSATGLHVNITWESTVWSRRLYHDCILRWLLRWSSG